MISQMKKIIFLGLKEEKESFIKRLQEVGVTHVDLPGDAVTSGEIARELQKVTEVRKFLTRLAEKQEKAEQKKADYAQICAKREELSQKEIRLQTEISSLKKERANTEPWSDFNPEDIALLKSKGLDVRFYRIPRRTFLQLPVENVFYHATRETEGEICFITFSAQPTELPGIREEKVPAKSLSAIDQEIREKEAEFKSIAEEYKAMSSQVSVLTNAEAKLTDEFEYRKVLMNVVSELDDRAFVLTCWSSVSEEELITRIGTGFTFTYVSSDPEPGDKVPVLLQNSSPFDSGEDLVKIYSQPNYSDFDPSGLVLWWFVIFYGMIIGDAGYGMLLIGLNLFLHIKIKSKSPLWIRFRRLNYFLGLSVTSFGIIGASYFGVALSPDNPLLKMLLLDFGSIQGQNFVMMVAILMGMVHISLALGIKFFRTKDLPSLGWIIVMWSGFAVAKFADPIAKWVLIAGFAIIILFSSTHKNVIIRLLIGLNASLGFIQLFADILSYMRLFALGLATMYMCQTFNMLAQMAYDICPPYVGYVAAAIVLVLGHGINITLGIMGGVVHGLRLNFLEWYRWCFEGDGLTFKPFKLVTLEKF